MGVSRGYGTNMGVAEEYERKMEVTAGKRSRRRGYLEDMGTNMGVAEGLRGGRRSY
jgi:hypothetical protein